MASEVQTVIKLKPGKYLLTRERDGIGENGEIHVGCSIQCGNFYARSYSGQDWWLTTDVTEILETNEDNSYVKFKTGNSVYIAKSF
jgi:hypothetical protein